ncbi:MAG: signal peptidase I [Parachlamydiales bacterium]|nr:signal peptidase I [Parachlamydiales bacterium]
MNKFSTTVFSCLETKKCSKIASMIGSFFSLRKSRRTFRLIHRHYKRKHKSLDQYTRESIEGYLNALREAILKKDSAEAKRMAKELDQASFRLMPKSSFDKARDFIGGLAFALLIAVLIRTTWFELYTIPTGSMRPTLKEEDYLIVSKTDYGINVPLQLSHFYFDPDLVQRGSIIVFNGGNMDIADVDTVYFYLFPGKKQFVKRLIAKPGDTVYFYGGHLYGIDADGKEIAEYRNTSWFQDLEHIPMIRFEGKMEMAQNGTALFHQMNIPVAKLMRNSTGEMLTKKASNFGDLWGMKHFAMARLLTRAEMILIHPEVVADDGILYLEMTHHPTLQGAKYPDLAVSQSIIPLQERHLKAISDHMTTCRFQVKDGILSRLGWNTKGLSAYLPKLPGVPDGKYEIIDGKAYQLPFPTIPFLGIFTNGVTRELPADHPLYSQKPEVLQKLFNLGFEPLNHYMPLHKHQKATPSRYAYFRDGDLYLMGGAIIRKDDPTLDAYLAKEKQKTTPFVDAGTPSLDEIRKFGLKIPEKMYLALGDNHAMSADSREFGFVPEDNLKGGVSFLFSPPGERWGQPMQPSQPHATFPNLTIWILFSIAGVASSLYLRRKLKKPLKF